MAYYNLCAGKGKLPWTLKILSIMSIIYRYVVVKPKEEKKVIQQNEFIGAVFGENNIILYSLNVVYFIQKKKKFNLNIPLKRSFTRDSVQVLILIKICYNNIIITAINYP